MDRLLPGYRRRVVPLVALNVTAIIMISLFLLTSTNPF